MCVCARARACVCVVATFSFDFLGCVCCLAYKLFLLLESFDEALCVNHAPLFLPALSSDPVVQHYHRLAIIVILHVAPHILYSP